MIYAGLYIARRVGLGTPILDCLTKKESIGEKVRAMWLPALTIGFFRRINHPSIG